MEVERFDRTPLKPSGRLGIVSLLVFDAQYVGQMDNWAATATRLVARQLLTPADANTLAQWPRGRELAQKFWQTAARDERLSAEFAATAQAEAPPGRS